MTPARSALPHGQELTGGRKRQSAIPAGPQPGDQENGEGTDAHSRKSGAGLIKVIFETGPKKRVVAVRKVRRR